MPRTEVLSKKNILDDARRLATLTALATNAAGPHNLLSVPHADAPTAAATRGDLIIASSVPDWIPLAIGTANQVLLTDGTDPAWTTLAVSHISDLAYATPNLTLGTANAAGAASTVIRSDATILAFDATVPNVIQPDDAAATGAATVAARRDHEHGIVAAAPSANSVSLAASSEGASTSFARADHGHNLDESITPTWTGNHVWDDGAGDSPSLSFVGGTNNDTVSVFLRDDAATANESDLVIVLPDTGNADTLFVVEDSGNTSLFEVRTDGDIYVNRTMYLGDRIRGANDSNTYIDRNSDEWVIVAGDVEFARFTETTQDETRFNNAGVDIDYIVEAVGVADALSINGANGAITLGVLGAGFVRSDANGLLSSSALIAGDLPSHTHSGAGQGGTVDHGALTGLGDDDHSAVYPGLAQSEIISGSWSFTNLSNYVAQSFIHYGDTDTEINFQTDRITLTAGGVDMLDLVEGVTDYSKFGSMVLVGTTSTTNMTLGLKIHQASATDEILAFQSTVAHGATDFTQTETFFRISQMDPGDGTAQLDGFADSAAAQEVGIAVRGFVAQNADTTKSTAARGLVEIAGYQISGTGIGATVADGNVCVWWTYRDTYRAIMILDEDGDLHLDGTTAAYHEEDDVAILREIDEVVSAERGRWRRDTRAETLGIIQPDDHSVMVSRKRSQSLQRGAILQLDERLQRVERALTR
jgi:hypothetical protein